MGLLKELLGAIRGAMLPTPRERYQMRESGITNPKERRAWLLGRRRRRHWDRFADLERIYAQLELKTVKEKRAFMLGKLNVQGGIGR